MNKLRVGLTYEKKTWFPFQPDDAPDANSELLSDEEEHELIEGLSEAGYDVVCIGDATRLLANIPHWQATCDVIFNRSVGYKGTERKAVVPCILDAAAIPYIGSSQYALLLTRNKYHAKIVAANAGLATPGAMLIDNGMATLFHTVTYPAIVKPIAESSSIGIEEGKAIVYSKREALQQAACIQAKYNQPALIESFVAGVEVEIPIIVDERGPQVLGIAAVSINGEIPPLDFYLSSESVYDDGYDYVPVPAALDPAMLSARAIKAAGAFGIRDYGRIDFRIDQHGKAWFIEASTHPHVQRCSSFYSIATWRGLSYAQMLNELIQVGTDRIARFTSAHQHYTSTVTSMAQITG